MNSVKNVPFFNYPAVYLRFAAEFQRALDDVGRRGAFIQQVDIAEFEGEVASYTGVRRCVTMSNATVGLQLAMVAGGLPEGAEVIISSHTMVATAASIVHAGGVPIPVEVGSDHQIDPQAISAAIGPRTHAICPTQLNGRTSDMNAIQGIADEFGLQIYEDAAQALGSRFQGRAAGSWGVGSCLSFYPAKILGTLGDGGAVLTNSSEIAEELLLLRDHGRVDRGDTIRWGFNARMDNLAAAFLRIQLRHFDETVARRREIAARYQERLAAVPGLSLPPAPDADLDHFDTFQNYEIECEYRDELQVQLASRGVGTLQQWGGWPVHKFAKLGFTQQLPNTDKLFSQMLMLPMNFSLTDEDVEYVCDSIVQIAETEGAK